MHGLEATTVFIGDIPTSHGHGTGDPIDPTHIAIGVCVFVVATTLGIAHWFVRSARHLRFHCQIGRGWRASPPVGAGHGPPSLLELCVLRV